MRVISVNVNGIRAATRKGFFRWLSRQRADFVCLQETKAQVDQLAREIRSPSRWHAYFADAQKKGYSGVALFSRAEPQKVISGLGVEEFDREGRFLQADFGNLSVVSVYFPSGSSGEIRQRVKYAFMEKFESWLESKSNDGREYLICGDWNIAHRQIDLKNWRSNQKNSGFLPEERAWMDKILHSKAWIDVFRLLNESENQYTWWSNRGNAWNNNVGWRLDYQIATKGLAESATGERIYKTKRFSDHAPVVIDYAADAESLELK